MSSTPSPLRELRLYYHRYQQVPTDWIRRFSSTGNLDEASQKAWSIEPLPGELAILAARFADRRTLARAAADLGRLMLPDLRKKKRALHEKALDFLDTWGEKPETPDPKLGWSALAESVAPEEDSDDLASSASENVVLALRVPGHPATLRSLVLGMHDHAAGRIMDAEGGREKRRSELEIDEIDGRAQEEMNPIMVERLRARIPAPDGKALLSALREDREYALNEALARNNKAQLATFQPE